MIMIMVVIVVMLMVMIMIFSDLIYFYFETFKRFSSFSADKDLIQTDDGV